MADEVVIPWLDFVDDLDPVIALNGSERMAGINSSNLSGTVTPTALKDYISKDVLMSKKISLTSQQILASSTTPVLLLPFLPAYQMYVILGVSYNKKFVSAAYTTNIDAVFAKGTIFEQALDGFLGFSASRSGTLSIVPLELPPAGGTPIRFSVNNGNPLVGNGTLDFYITYYIINI